VLSGPNILPRFERVLSKGKILDQNVSLTSKIRVIIIQAYNSA